jgi:Tfp pilus assembly protein PilZ
MEKKTYFDVFGGGTVESPEAQGETATSAPKTAPRGGRMSERILIGMSIKIQNKDGLEDYATTRNVSNRGVCFKSSKPYKVAEEVMVELYVGPNRHVGPLPGRIVWCIPEGESWEHGINWSKKVNMGVATAAPTADPK